eukprot:6197311-Pleurochrysis_carterae.AAC.5
MDSGNIHYNGWECIPIKSVAVSSTVIDSRPKQTDRQEGRYKPRAVPFTKASHGLTIVHHPIRRLLYHYVYEAYTYQKYEAFMSSAQRVVARRRGTTEKGGRAPLHSTLVIPPPPSFLCSAPVPRLCAHCSWLVHISAADVAVRRRARAWRPRPRTLHLAGASG